MGTNRQIVQPGENIFAVLDVPDAADLQVKAKLANEICKVVSERGLTQSDAARLMGTTQAKVSDIVRCKLDGFSIDRLFRFLNGLGRDIEISVLSTPEGREARVTVAGP